MFRPEALAARARPAPAPTPLGLGRWSGGTTAWLVGSLLMVLLVAAALIPSPEVIRGRAVVRYGDVQTARSPSEGVVGSLLVAPGDVVEAGDPVAVLASSAIMASFERRRADYRDAVRRMLRAPTDLAARSEVGQAQDALQRASEARDLQIVRAPASGSVLALHTHVGASLPVLAPVCEIREGSGPPSLIALFAGNERPRIHDGAPLRVVFDEFPKAPLDTTVETAADTIVSPQVAAVFTSTYLSAGFPAGSSVVTVQAPLEVDGRAVERGLDLYEGMTANVELVVRDRSILARLLAPGGML